MNNDGIKDKLFISYNKEDDVKEMMGEVDQTVNDGNRESVEIEIEKEETNNLIDDNYSTTLAESDEEEQEK